MAKAMSKTTKPRMLRDMTPEEQIKFLDRHAIARRNAKTVGLTPQQMRTLFTPEQLSSLDFEEREME